MHRHFTQEEDEILLKYYGLLSYKEIDALMPNGPRGAKNLNQRLDKLGVKLKPLGTSCFSRNKKSLRVNHNFFSIPSIRNAYWAGFIATDGNIAKSKPMLTISLALKDINHLERFILDLDTDYTVHITKTGCAIWITSQQIVDDLKKHWNIVSCKTLILEPPNISDPHLIKAFLAGVIDGDGSTGIYNQSSGKTKILKLSVACASPLFSDFISNNFTFLAEGKISIIKKINNKAIDITTTGFKAAKILKALFSTELPLLQRKWYFVPDLPTEKVKGFTMFGEEKKYKALHKNNIVEEIS